MDNFINKLKVHKKPIGIGVLVIGIGVLIWFLVKSKDDSTPTRTPTTRTPFPTPYPSPSPPPSSKIECYDLKGGRQCKPGYRSRDENPKLWGCGKDCVGGKFLTDVGCNCSCIPANQCKNS